MTTSPLLEIPAIDDAHDTRVNRCFCGQKWKRRFAPADEEHMLAHTRADGINRDERTSDWLPIGRDRLQHEQLVAVERSVLDAGHDVADDLRELHDRQSWIVTSI
jgi:hypothetical protein